MAHYCDSCCENRPHRSALAGKTVGFMKDCLSRIKAVQQAWEVLACSNSSVKMFQD